MMFAAFFVVFIPLLFLLSLGTRMTSKVRMFPYPAVLSLLGVWCTAIIIAGVIGVKLTPEYEYFIATSPLYKETVREMPLADFTNITVRNGNKVNVTLGEKFKVTVNGTTEAIDNLSLKVEDDTLNIEGTRDKFKICIFCGRVTPEVVVVLPKLANISAANGSRITATDIKGDALTLKLSNGSHATMSLNVKNVSVDEANASWSTLSGVAVTANMNLANGASIDAENLTTNDATVVGQNGSVVKIHVDKTLKADLQNGSLLFYEGSPKIEKKTSNGSRVEIMQEEIE